MTDRCAINPADPAAQLQEATYALLRATRRMSNRDWLRPVAGGDTAAERVHALAVTLAQLEHSVENGSAPRPARWRSPDPPAYPAALPDRLAVLSNDLVAAVRSAPDNTQVWYDDRLVPLTHLTTAAMDAIQATADALALQTRFS